MEETVNEIKALLNEFNGQTQSPTSDENIPAKIGNYSLNPEDISGQVIDWILSYLENRKCPHHLAIAIARKTAQQIESTLSEQYVIDNINETQGKLFNSATVYAEAVKMLPSVCNSLLDQSNLDEMCSLRSSSSAPYVASVFAIKNKRRKMEDKHVIHHDLNALLDLKNVPHHSYYAVFDGHSGIDAASYASAQLHINIVRHPSFLTDTVTAISEAYRITDENFLKKCAKENIKSGCTAVCALIRENTVYLSWLGDSQAVLVKQGKPLMLTNPHKPEREDERKRIESLGGHITYMGIWRVNGIIAVTRALGDPDHKPFISSEPEMSIFDLDGTEDFLILACDGLWDGLSPEDVTAALYSNIADSNVDEPLDTIAAKLVHQSKIQGSEDNITAVVIFLRDIKTIKENAIKLLSKISQPSVHLGNILGVNGEKKYSLEEMSSMSFTKPTVLELNAASSKKLKNTANVMSSAGLGSSYSYHYSENAVEGASFQNISPDFAAVASAQNIFVPHQNLASCFAPEATALSELPTPPIDDVLASQQFGSDLYQGLSSIIPDTYQQNYSVAGSAYDINNSGLLVSEGQSQHSFIDTLPEQLINYDDTTGSSGINCTETNSISSKEAEVPHDSHITPDEAVGIASCVVTNAIETAVKCLSSSELPEAVPVESPQQRLSSSELPEAVPVHSPQKLNPYAEPFVMKSFFTPENSKLQDKIGVFSEQNLAQENISTLSPPVKENENLTDMKSASDTALLADFVTSELNEILNINQNISKEITEKYDSNSENVLTEDPLNSVALISTTVQNLPVTESELCHNEQSQLNNLNSDHILSTDIENSLLCDIAESKPLHEGESSHEFNVTTPYSQPDIISEAIFTSTDLKNEENVNLIYEHPSNLGSGESCDLASESISNLVTESVSTKVIENLNTSLIDNVCSLVTENTMSSITETSDILTSGNLDILGSKQEDADLSAVHTDNLETNSSLILENIGSPLIKTAPVDESTSAPVMENTGAPVMENTGAPVIENTSAPVTESTSAPVTESTSAPVTESAGAPVTESAGAPVMESTSALVMESTSAPVTESAGTPVTVSSPSSLTEATGNLKNEIPDNASISNKEECKISEKSPLLDGITKEPLSLMDVQNELLKSTEVVLPADQVVEDLHVETFAVDLQSVPDGIPEAEGVTEDIDSDSEKDGGWSYMKGNTISGSKTKTDEKTAKVEKIACSKPELSSKTKKEISKPTLDLKNKTKTTSLLDKGKKPTIEKKTLDVKEKSKMVKSSTLASVTKSSSEKATRITTTSRLKKETLMTTSKVTTTAASKISRPAIPKNVGPSVKPGSAATTDRNVSSTKTVTSSGVNVKSKTVSSVHDAKSNNQPISSTLPKGQPSNQSINKPNTTSVRSASNRFTTSVPSRVAPVAKPISLSRPSPSESKAKQPTTIIRKTASSTLKKPDVKETKDSVNKQISAARNITLATRKIETAAIATVSNKRTTNLNNKSSVSKTFSSTSVKSEISKRDVPKIPPSKFPRNTMTAKVSKVEAKGKDKKALSVQSKEDQKKNNLAIVAGEERNTEVVSVSEEEKFILETNDKETVVKEQSEISPTSSEKPLENGNLAECVKLVEDKVPASEHTPESLL